MPEQKYGLVRLVGATAFELQSCSVSVRLGAVFKLAVQLAHES